MRDVKEKFACFHGDRVGFCEGNATETENGSSSLDEGRLRNLVPMDVNFDLQLEEWIQLRG